jgi:ribosome silencing factor RsfS/YbeB/iojap
LTEPEIEETLRQRGLRLSFARDRPHDRRCGRGQEGRRHRPARRLELTSMADYFVICSGGSERQLGAIGDGISEKLRAEGVRPIGREGGSNSHWTLLDFGAVIVHIFAPPERDYYQLERHWAKAKTVLRVQ